MLRPQHSRPFHLTICLLSLLATGALSGCINSFLDPTEMPVPYEKKPLMVNILKNLDTGYEEPNPEFAQATEPRPEDNVSQTGDYTIGANDLLAVTITDLVGPNIESVKNTRVSESGKITLPLINQVQAAGLTEAQLEAAIQQAYRDARLIQNAQVSVIVLESRNRVFSILGSVARPGLYQILQSDFRLMDAFTTAGDINSTNIDYIYIIRRTDKNPPMQGGAGGMAPMPATRPTNTDILTPRGQANPPAGQTHPLNMMARAQDAAMQPATQPVDAEGRPVIIEGREVPTGAAPPPPTPPADMPMGHDQTAPPTNAKPFEFEAPEEPGNVRVIKVPLEELRNNGKQRYNVVVRPGDVVWVPSPVIGEYYMGGHIARVGVYSLTARKITLKQAVISAGMLDALAIPQRTSIIRRVRGQDKEIFASIDLAKIFAGEEPDVYLKPDDQVMVGTIIWAPFVAALRNGFRITYGFGFLYDRNYFDQNNR